MNSQIFLGLKYGKLILTLAEVATELGMEVGTAHNKISAGTFPIPTTKRGKNRVADLRDLAEYIDNQREQSKLAFKA